MADTIFAGYGTFRWVVGSFDIPLPVQTLEQVLANRIVPHKRIYREGARHDDTGAEPTTWSCTFLAHNDSDEPGIPPNYYPDQVLQLEQSAAAHEVGTLYTTRGPRRCRFVKCTIRESLQDGEDAATVSCSWVEDNEDDVKAASFQTPSARSVAQGQLDLATSQLDALGIGGGNFFDSLKEATRALVALAEGPGDTVAELEREARIVTDSIDQIESAFADATVADVSSIGALLTDPMSAAPGRALRRLADSTMRAAGEQALAQQTQPLAIRRYATFVSIFDVGNDLDQDAYDLLELNKQLPNPYAIQPGTPIKVFADPAMPNAPQA